MTRQKISVQINIASFAHGTAGASDRHNYTEALKAELASAADYREDYLVEAICLTGPNLLQYPADKLTDIIETLRKNLEFQRDVEITVNALPGSVTYADLRALREHGVNRISFDMRTFVPAELDALGRSYAPRALEVFMRMVQLKMTFFNYDITLHYGLPGQTFDTLNFSIVQAIRYMGMHITLLAHDQLENSRRMEFYQEAMRIIGGTSFKRYTPIHFAREGYASRWNKAIYSNQPRLGFGVGAVSAIDGVISRNTTDVQTYVEAAGDPSKLIVSMEPITQNRVDSNTVLDSLFNLEPCDLSLLSSEVEQRVRHLIERGLLYEEDDAVALTETGKMDWHIVAGELAF
jgi:oxygen-independent coproporphyrinogen-3 oxidase